MGDVRYQRSLDRAERARGEPDGLHDVSTEDLVEALAALGQGEDAVLANVIATELLNRSKRALAILEYLPDGVASLDADGRVAYVNPSAAALLGRTHEECMGRDFHDLVHHAKGGRAIPRSECGLLSVLERDAPEVRTDDHDEFERADGSTFLAGFAAKAVHREGARVGAVVIFRDITQAKEREARLALAHAAMDAIAEPIFWVARDGAILHANVAASDHLGYARDELTSMRVFDVDARMTPGAWDAHWERVKREGFAVIESVHVTRSGERVRVEVRIMPLVHEAGEFHVGVVRRLD